VQEDLLDNTKQLAIRVRNAKDITMPHPKYFADFLPNGDAFELKAHQRVGITWLYIAKKGLLADTVGLGKTIQIMGCLALMKERGELTERCIIVMRPAALLQWRDEFAEKAPKIRVDVAVGTRAQRIERYCGNWDVMLIGYQMLLQDIEMLARLDINMLVSDDVDPLRNADTKTAYAIKRLSRDCERVVVTSGTPLQTRLHELHSLFEPIGGRAIFGTEEVFKRRYVREEPITIRNLKTGRKETKIKVVGYKNMAEFKELIQPIYLRRTHHDLDGADLPALMPEDIWLDLHDAQREAYRELQAGIVRMINEEGVGKIKHATALAKLMYGAQICAGLETLGQPIEIGKSSVKLDWVVDKLTGDLAEDKVVIFCQFKNTIKALHERLNAEGVGYVTMWGDEPDAEWRRSQQKKFWDDSSIQACIGTSAMEQSLNLQVSNVLINVDMLMNPARMEQLAGRIRRLGSKHSHAWVFNLLTRDTQEERYLPIIESRQALADFVFGESSELFEQLSPTQLLALIKP